MSTHAIAIARECVEMSKRDLESAQRSGNVSRGEHAKRHLTEATGDLAEALEAESRRTHPTRAAAPVPPTQPKASAPTKAPPAWVPPSLSGFVACDPSDVARGAARVTFVGGRHYVDGKPL